MSRTQAGRGICSQCHRILTVTMAGAIRHHTRISPDGSVRLTCPGAGRRPHQIVDLCTTHGCKRHAVPGSFHCRKDQPAADLAVLLGVDDFDAVMVGIEQVVEEAQSLALDSAEDRAELCRRLRMKLGSVS